MTDFNRLLRPFSKEQVRERQGRKNMFFKYVPSHFVVERLNEIGTENWQFFIKESKEIGNEIVVLGSLSIFGVTKEAYGSSTIDEKKTAGDSFKTAQALSLVKACSLFGIPSVFHNTTQQQQKNNTHNHYQQPAVPPVIEEKPFSHACMDCGVVISGAEVQFSRRYPDTFKGKELCRECQTKYKQNIRRVK